MSPLDFAKMAAAGVCHSDYHVMCGDLAMPLPIILGHEGADRVLIVGGGEDNHREFPGGKLLDHREAVEVGHPHVEEDEVEPAVLLQLLETGHAVLGEVDLELHASQDGLQQHTDGEIVVDDVELDGRPVDEHLLGRDLPGEHLEGPQSLEELGRRS